MNSRKNKGILGTYRLLLTFSIFLALCVPVIDVHLAFALQRVIDSGVNQNLEEFKIAILICIVNCLASIGVNSLYLHSKNKYILKAVTDYKVNTCMALLKLDYDQFSSKNTGSYISTLTNDMKKLEESYIVSFINVVKNIFQMTIAVLAMLYSNWRLAIVVIVTSILPSALVGIMGGKVSAAQEKVVLSDRSYTTKIKDFLTGFMVIKSFQVESEINKEINKTNRAYSHDLFKLNTINAITEVTSNVTGTLIFIATFGVGIYMVIQGQTTIGGIITITQLLNYITMPLNTIGVDINQVNAGKEIIKKVSEIVPDNHTDDSWKESNDGKEAAFEQNFIYDNVSFCYPTVNEQNEEKQEFSLKGVNLTFEKGKKYAIVGLSGSGKSTLLNLLLRLYDLNESSGSILMDGRNINDISIENLYNLMSVVQQDVFIFDNTIKFNITLNKKFSEDEILRAVEMSNLKAYVETHPSGLDALCGENGINLSGGEKQRIAIARSIIRKTPILLMDEAMSALDQQTTFEIEDVILNIKDLTAVVITHKISKELLYKYNQIIYISNGQIIETGTFDDLIQAKGEFYNLYHLSV